jgi:formylglycine-generating enzyme required for sulfatase activity
MGSTAGRPDEAPVHEVTLPPFWLAEAPLTRGEYAAFLEDTGERPPRYWHDPGFGDADQPVVGVTWFEATGFASWLSSKLGREFRLPSEAEWERAARGGLPESRLGLPPPELPWGALEGPWRVKQGQPNPYGLFDMGTIVHEWCLDWYGAGYYAVSPTTKPLGPEEGERRASRGGSWRHHVRFSPPWARSSLPPDLRYADYGFRLAADAS